MQDIALQPKKFHLGHEKTGASGEANATRTFGDTVGSYPGLPHLILLCGGTLAAIPHIPAAKPPPRRRRLCPRLPLESPYSVLGKKLRT